MEFTQIANKMRTVRLALDRLENSADPFEYCRHDCQPMQRPGQSKRGFPPLAKLLCAGQEFAQVEDSGLSLHQPTMSILRLGIPQESAVAVQNLSREEYLFASLRVHLRPTGQRSEL